MDGQNSDYEALQIDCRLATDVVYQSPIHGDALLTYLMIEHEGDFSVELAADYPLPVRKLATYGRWFWDCSDSILINERKRSIDSNKRRYHVETLPRKSVNVAGLQYGSKMTLFERIQADAVRFFCFGDRQALSSLLEPMAGCLHIGSLRSKGFGLVSRIEISTVSMQYCSWNATNMVALRNIPVREADWLGMLAQDGIFMRRGRFRPPYYETRDNQSETAPLICAGSTIDLSGVIEVVR